MTSDREGPEIPRPVERRIELPDGRRLGAAIYGAPAGMPVIYQHGFPGSRKEALWVHGRALASGVRLVAVDRPGYGASDPKPGRRLLDWPADVAAAADALGIDRFALLGVSGGGPYACACARELRDRVERLLLVCALGPTEDERVLRRMFAPNRVGLRLARRIPWVPVPVFVLLAPAFRRYPEALANRLASRLPSRDRGFFERDDCRQAFVATLREAFRQGHAGAAADATIYASPWGFGLEEIRVRARLWHGEADTIVPPEMGRLLARGIPGCESTFVPGEGHFSLILAEGSAFFERTDPEESGPVG